jgi:diguanylate cyclase (GGDEF)-like protein
MMLAAAPVDPPTRVETAPTDGASLRILTVEDDVAYADCIAMMLESVGSITCELEHVPSLRRATEHLKRTPFQVVLLDLDLGDARGLETLNAVVELVPDTPIVILSGYDNLADSLQAVKSGAQDFLLKSQVTPETLARSIRYAIERKHAELATKEIAYRDGVTGLPNRHLLMEHFELALQRAKRGNSVLGVFFIDIDRFKHINDTFGHEAGDTVLREVARRLKDGLRASDTLARLSGDEFVGLVETKRRAELAVVADTVQRQFRTPFIIQGGEVFITASIGLSSYPADGADGRTLLRNADKAMYRAKEDGRDTHRFYSPRHHTNASRYLALRTGLRGAVERGELVVHYQPLVDLRGGGVDGLEALVRWDHPSLGLIAPADFIPIAEEIGMMLSIDRWVLQSAIQQAMSLQGQRPIRVAVNLSARHFEDPGLLVELQTLARAGTCDPGLLEFELTESGITDHPGRVVQQLMALRELGVRVAIDDFGTGYSCLKVMNRLPLHALKIDRSFVSDCATNPADQTLIAAIITMGHALGLKVTAEGVETNEQLTYLQAQGCDRAQGWLFSPAVNAAELPRVFQALAHFRAGL